MSDLTQICQTLAQELGDLLQARGETIACAESCTGGLIAATLTDIAGSSAWFGWGVVSYANAAKMELLGVTAADLETHGAVSAPVVQAMTSGIRRISGANWCVAVSGIAGPGGGSADKPVGTVWIAIESSTDCFCESCYFSGSRADIRWQTVHFVLKKLHDLLKNTHKNAATTLTSK